jgi:hypothetical protein
MAQLDGPSRPCHDPSDVPVNRPRLPAGRETLAPVLEIAFEFEIGDRILVDCAFVAPKSL